MLATVAALALPRGMPAPTQSTLAPPPSPSTPASTTSNTPSTVALRQLAKSSEWVANTVLYSRRYLSPESPLWNAPPASRPAHIAPLPRLTPARYLVLGAVTDVPEGNLVFQLEDGRTARIAVPSKRSSLPLALRTGDALAEVWVEERGLIFTPDLTRHASAPLGQAGATHEIVLPLRHATGAAVVRYEVSELDVDEVHPRVAARAARQLSDLEHAVDTGSVDYDVLEPWRTVEVDATGRYTIVLVAGERDLRPFLRCTRDGEAPEPIGAYAPALPFFVATVNDARSLRLEFVARRPGEHLAFSIHALSADDVMAKEVVLWAVPRIAALADRPGGKVPSQAAAVATVRWLLKSLGVRFSAAEALAASDPEQRSLLQHLARLSEEVDR